MRTMLYEAAQAMMRSKKWSWLKAWAMQIARRRGKGLGADSEEKREPVGDIDIAVLDSLKVLDPRRPIREGDMAATFCHVRFTPNNGHGLKRPGCPLCANRDISRRSKLRRYSITSSASAASFSGSLRPRVLATLPLITS